MSHFTRNTLLSVLFLHFVLLAGCKEKDTLAENDIRFNTIEKTASYHFFNLSENPHCDFSVNFTYPEQIENEKMLPKLQNKFIVAAFGEKYTGLAPREAIERYAESYINTYKEIEPDYKTDRKTHNESEDSFASWYNYNENISNEIVFNRAHIIAFTNKLETYTGGAHGARQYTNYVINLNTGCRIDESDIFIEGFKEPISYLLIEKIAEFNHVENVSELIEIGYFGIEEIQPNNNFLINEQGITYTFNEYEIAAYVIGATKVLLTFDEIGLYLKKENPIAHLLRN